MSSTFTFSRSKNGSDRGRPKTLSVLCLNKNHAAYLEDNLLSVASQKFDDFEYLVADGGSTDESLAILARYDFVSVLAGSDRSRDEGILRAAEAATGRFVMFTTSTDGYLSRNWFHKATSALDSQPEVALVWGATATMLQDGTLGRVAYPRTFDRVPQKREWFFRWINDRRLSGSYLPELNYCVRTDVFQRCLQRTDEFPELDEMDPILRFLFRFNREEFLPFYLPVLASYGRVHDNFQTSPYIGKSMANYQSARRRYRGELRQGTKTHVFRDGAGSPMGELKNPKLGWTSPKVWQVVGRSLIERFSGR